MRRFCILCGSESHNPITCERGKVQAELSLSEWLHIYLTRRFGSLREAAEHYRIKQASVSMGLAGLRPLPAQMLKDAGVSFDVNVKVTP